MRFILAALLFFASFLSYGQSSYLTLNEDYYHMIDRYEIKTGKVMPFFFSTVKPYKRSDIVAFADSVEQLGMFTSRADRFNYEYINVDSWEWSKTDSLSKSRRPILKYFYRKKPDLIHVKIPDFDLHINPVLYLGVGNDTQRDDMLTINTRGIEMRGMIDKRVSFYTYLTDNQAVLPSYVWDDVVNLNPVIPHEGFWKEFKEGKGVDFFQARGSVTVDASRHINFQLGHDRFFIGNGYRSLVFSDNAPPSLFLKTSVKVWKLNYTFLVSQATAAVTDTLNYSIFPRGSSSGLKSMNSGYPQKFTAFHHFSINIGKKLNIGVYEVVVFSTDDETGATLFRFDYLNPIIFYRAIEQQNGSSDNVLLGLDFKWNMVRKLSLYGQFMLDEFVLSNVMAGDGWWANKFAIQAGAKYIDAFGVPNLDLQGEFNMVRPYTYSHNTMFGNYSSYQQSLAHPMGANLNEVVGILRYQPLPRLNIVGKLVMTNVGRDSLQINDETKYSYGGDIMKRNTGRYTENGNEIGQGISNSILFGSFTASWHLKHNIFIDAQVVIRQSKSDLAYYNKNTTITSLALRWNIARRLYEF